MGLKIGVALTLENINLYCLMALFSLTRAMERKAMKQEQDQPSTEKRYIKQAEVMERTSLSSNTIRTLEARGKFPKRVAMSDRAVRWYLPDVLAWMKDPEGWKPST